MNRQHRIHKYLFLLTICILVASLLLPGCGGGAVVEEEEEEEKVAGILDTSPPPETADIPEGTPHSWQASYTEIYFNDFESSLFPGLELSGQAELTTDAVDGSKSVIISNWGSIDTNPDELPLYPNTHYIYEIDYRIISTGNSNYILESLFFPEGSSNEEDSMHCQPMLANSSSEGTYSTGGLTTSDAPAYYLKVQSTEGVSIIIDNIRIFRQDNIIVTSPPNRWAELADLPYPRLANFQLGTTNHLAEGSGLMPDWPEGELVYEPEDVEEKLSFFNITAGLNEQIQSMDTAFFKKLREQNPDMIILPYVNYVNLCYQHPSPHATIDLTYEFNDNMPSEWLAKHTNGDSVECVSFPGIFVSNYFDSCPVVRGQTYTEAYIDFIIDGVIASGVWDGILIDNCIARAFYDVPNFHNPSLYDFDINLNGQRDETLASVSEASREATLSFLKQLRSELGDNAMIITNCGPNPDLCTAPYVNGFTFEIFLEPWFCTSSTQPNEGAWRRTLSDYFATQESTRAPHINILEGAGDHCGSHMPDRNYLEPTADDIVRCRLGLGTALLGDGFYEYDLYDNRSIPYFFDEFMVNDAGVSVEDSRYKGYLGMPLDDAEELASPATIIWEEKFDSGSLPSSMEGEGKVENGRLVIDNPNHTTYEQYGTGVNTKVGSIPFTSGKTYVFEFDWEILETLDDDFSLIVNSSGGFLGSYSLPEVIAGESGSICFPVTLSSGSNFQLAFNLRSGGGKVAIDNIKVYEGGAGPWRRDFENGFVLVNPINKDYTFSAAELAGDFNRTGIKRILGTQAPDANNGQPVTGTLTLQPFDAIILLADHISSH